LLKLGIDIGETSVGKYLVRHRKPPSQTWRTFLDNHLKRLVSVDFFTVPTIRFQILYVFPVLAHDRRRILHCNVTAHPTAEWTAQQLRDAFPWDSAPRYLLRDRDRIFGDDFTKQVQDMGIQEVLSAPRAPWQRAYVERVIGTIRRECLDHVIVFNEVGLYRHLKSFVAYYHRAKRIWDSARTRRSRAPSSRRNLAKLWPSRRSADSTIATNGEQPESSSVVSRPQHDRNCTTGRYQGPEARRLSSAG
jgi:transposase InsO family protein